MKFSDLSIPCALLVFAAGLAAAQGSRRRVAPDIKKTLGEAGLEYGGSRLFRAEKNNRRGDWQGKKPAFWTLTAAAGSVRLRLELTKNVARAFS